MLPPVKATQEVCQLQATAPHQQRGRTEMKTLRHWADIARFCLQKQPGVTKVLVSSNTCQLMLSQEYN